MSGTHIHAMINAILWILIQIIIKLLKIDSDIFTEDPWINGLVFVIGGSIFDLDHFLYYISTTKPLNINNIKERMESDYKTNNPHFYICHNIEFIAILLPIFVLYNLNTQIILLLGWTIHNFTDILDYILYYKSLMPWIPYYSGIYYLITHI